MPGLRLTEPQVERLCTAHARTSASALRALVSAGFLRAMSDGSYGRTDVFVGRRDIALAPSNIGVMRSPWIGDCAAGNGFGHDMRIAVTDVGRTFGRQTRAYAEYRIFSSLARFSPVVREVDVSLTPAGRTDGLGAVCVVVIIVGDGLRVQVRAVGRHAYDAINRAAQRSGEALRRHTDVQLSS